VFALDIGKTTKERDQFILLSILCLCIGILSTDLLVPLGFVIWILYLIPLLMSVWLSYRYAPFVITWMLTLVILLGSMISGSAQANPSDLTDRAIFILMLAIISILAWEIKTNYEVLEIEICERSAAQEKLVSLTRTLEERVSLRTQELSDVNEKLKQDIAERRKVESALAMTNQKLTLLSQITRHDILNQLTVLKGYAILSQQFENDPEKLRMYHENALRAATTIEHQISFTRDYENMGMKSPVWQNVGEMIAQAVSALPMRDVVVHSDDIHIEVFADPLFERVFYNLIDNALRHGEGITSIAFSYHVSDAALVIVCEDDGVGIPDQDKQHIFTKGFGRDSGLGLFLIREILSITGISIKETGVSGKGARFEITVPSGHYSIGHDSRDYKQNS
jgi:signal transduction histidine kinase